MRGRTSILVVEDDLDVKFILDLILEREDFRLINAYNGQEAVDRYREHRPDLVLMDIMMPVKTGDVAIREILDFDPAATIIAVTAYSHSRQSLGVPVLRKGFRKDELLETIRKTLDGLN